MNFLPHSWGRISDALHVWILYWNYNTSSNLPLSWNLRVSPTHFIGCDFPKHQQLWFLKIKFFIEYIYIGNDSKSPDRWRTFGKEKWEHDGIFQIKLLQKQEAPLYCWWWYLGLKVYEPGIVPNTLLIKFSTCKVFDRFYNDTIRLSENMIPSSNVHVAYGMCYNYWCMCRCVCREHRRTLGVQLPHPPSYSLEIDRSLTGLEPRLAVSNIQRCSPTLTHM